MGVSILWRCWGGCGTSNHYTRNVQHKWSYDGCYEYYGGLHREFTLDDPFGCYAIPDPEKQLPKDDDAAEDTTGH
jgi:hypothetical protein